MTTLTIELNQQERQLADLLVDCAHWIDENPHEVDALRLKDERGEWIGKQRSDEPVELRMAGGWVRDKLLGVDSSDIDVATAPDPITGLKFATLLEKYLQLKGQRDLMGKLTKIEAKPEQSKHLETATAMLCGLSVDWVQMRGNEVYSPNSRIPTVEFGTALQDAERRDLTINALFYNLRTREIEDQTGKGLADLGLVPGQPKRIRTPLDPFHTFSDDPLRVVRSVRFAARFGTEFQLDDGLVAAVQRPEIRAALQDPKKISRERVGVELEKMLLHKNAFLAIELILRLNLHELVFLYDASEIYSYRFPDRAPPERANVEQSLVAASILRSLLGTDGQELHPALDASKDLHLDAQTTKRLYLSCCLLPLYDLYVLEKTKPVWLGEQVVRDAIKWPTLDRVWVSKARDASLALSAFVKNRALTNEGDEVGPGERGDIGMLLRGLGSHDSHQTPWNIYVFWSLVHDLTTTTTTTVEERVQVKRRYDSFVRRVVELGLDQASFEPVILDGAQVLAVVPEAKGSPATTAIMMLVMRFQLDRPEATADDARNFLKGDGKAEVERLLREGQEMLLAARAAKTAAARAAKMKEKQGKKGSS